LLRHYNTQENSSFCQNLIIITRTVQFDDVIDFFFHLGIFLTCYKTVFLNHLDSSRTRRIFGEKVWNENYRAFHHKWLRTTVIQERIYIGNFCKQQAETWTSNAFISMQMWIIGAKPCLINVPSKCCLNMCILLILSYGSPYIVIVSNSSQSVSIPIVNTLASVQY